MDFEIFRKDLEKIFVKERKSNAGAKPYDPVMMFKILILQSLYNLSDDAMEFQILDRYSFSRFLGIHEGSKVPDSTTIWNFREALVAAGIVKELFLRFDEHLRDKGFEARKGQIIDASIVSVPRQRNSRDENQGIKEGKIPADWSDNKKRQKDTDARWVKKNGKSFFGYKNHVSVDVQHKLIREYAVTTASVHDSNIFDELIDKSNSSRALYADSAYRSDERIKELKEQGYREHIQRKGSRHHKLTAWERQGNRTRSKTRSRIEHVFGVQAKKAGNLLLRTIGIVRARAKIGLRNLAYNMDRFGMLLTAT